VALNDLANVELRHAASATAPSRSLAHPRQGRLPLGGAAHVAAGGGEIALRSGSTKSSAERPVTLLQLDVEATRARRCRRAPDAAPLAPAGGAGERPDGFAETTATRSSAWWTATASGARYRRAGSRRLTGQPGAALAAHRIGRAVGAGRRPRPARRSCRCRIDAAVALDPRADLEHHRLAVRLVDQVVPIWIAGLERAASPARSTSSPASVTSVTSPPARTPARPRAVQCAGSTTPRAPAAQVHPKLVSPPPSPAAATPAFPRARRTAPDSSTRSHGDGRQVELLHVSTPPIA